MTGTIRVPILYGTAAFGVPVENTITTIHEPADAQRFIDVLIKYGQVGLDTSRFYSGGTSEELLGRLDLKSARIDTKIFPSSPGDHEPTKLRETFQKSLTALGPHKIRVFYLHAPDRSVPFEDTLRAVDELYKQAHFEEFGLSNFAAREVAEIVGICKANGWIRPTVYQGLYNVLDRKIEAELVPCARKYGLRLAAFSPLAGGFLVGSSLKAGEAQSGSHFDPKWAFGSFYIQRYLPMTPAVQELEKIIANHQLTLRETAIRWLQHHSVLGTEDLGIIFGASKPEQLEDTLKECTKGPLPDEVVTALDAAYKNVQGNMPRYAP